MTPAEMVTTFALTPETTCGELCKALTRHCAERGIVPDEYGISTTHWTANKDKLPAKVRWYVAFAVEGGSEGYYVHIGAMLGENDACAHLDKRHYINIGLAKMNTAEPSYRMAQECQRFLTAMMWN